MKRFLGIIPLILLLITPLKANDIKKFQIDDMSIGDSLLNFFSEEEIIKGVKTNYPGSKEFYGIHFFSKSDTYDQYSFMIKSNDKKYRIYSLSGDIYFIDDLPGCLKKKEEIVKDVSSMFSNVKKNTYSHEYKTLADGKSFAKITDLENLKNGLIRIFCNTYSKKAEKLGYKDTLVVNISTNELTDWINNKAYK
tara:strand:- start:50 stop:631 length:582 start_codon:yes stop_codon:yes gene_type:complete